MLDRQWLRLLKEKGGPRYEVGPIAGELEGIYREGALFMTPMPGHFDYDLRLAAMDEAGIDLAPTQSGFSSSNANDPIY